MEIIRKAGQILNKKAAHIFAERCGVAYPVEFSNKVIKISNVPDGKVASLLFKQKYYLLLDECCWWGQSRVEIYFQGCVKPLVVKAMTQQTQVITPAFFASAGWVSRPLYDAFGRLLDNPESKKGITRASKQYSERQQLYVTQAAASAIKTTAQRASTRLVTDYIYLPDLEEIDQIIDQQGTQSGGVTVRYRATLGGTSNSDPAAEWGWFTAQTFVFEDDFHIFYRESEILNIEKAAVPLSLITA